MVGLPDFPDLATRSGPGFQGHLARSPARRGRLGPLALSHQLESLDLAEGFIDVSSHRRGEDLIPLDHPVRIDDKAVRGCRPRRPRQRRRTPSLPCRRHPRAWGKGTPVSTILDSSLSTHILWTKTLSMLMESTSTPSFWNSACFSATAEISVASDKRKITG